MGVGVKWEYGYSGFYHVGVRKGGFWRRKVGCGFMEREKI